MAGPRNSTARREAAPHLPKRERVRIAANLRHDVLDDVITEQTIPGGAFDAPFAAELSFLWRVARALLARREEARQLRLALRIRQIRRRSHKLGRLLHPRYSAAAPIFPNGIGSGR